MLSRRKLFQLGAAILVTPVLRDQTYAINTSRARWSGWLKPVNQLVEFGYWISEDPTNPRQLLVTSTLGKPQIRKAGEQIDLVREQKCQWYFESDDQREAAKQAALARHVIEYRNRVCHTSSQI